jgi:hypothetical protein
MPRGGPRPNSGGARPGAGRPPKQHTQVEDSLAESSRTPLEYMLAVMNDPAADPIRRDKMAQAAAPFVHPKLGSVSADDEGKKATAAKNAKTADAGTGWAGLLQ